MSFSSRRGLRSDGLMVSMASVVCVSLLALPLTWGLALSCNETAFAECWKTLESYMSDAQVLFPVYDDATLQEVCRSLNETLACNQNLKRTCSREDRHVIEGIELAATYLCGEGYETYYQERTCFSQEIVMLAASQCETSYRASMDGVTHMVGSLDDKKHVLCSAISTFISCLALAVQSACGAAAGDWILTIKSHMMLPTRRAIGCLALDPHGDQRGTPPVLGIVMGAGLGLLTLTFIVLLLCRKQLQAYSKGSKFVSRTRNTSMGLSKSYHNGAPSSICSVGTSTAPLLDCSPQRAKNCDSEMQPTVVHKLKTAYSPLRESSSANSPPADNQAKASGDDRRTLNGD